MTVYSQTPLNIRLSASQLDTIDRIRSHTHESRSSLIRRLLQEALDRYEGRVG